MMPPFSFCQKMGKKASKKQLFLQIGYFKRAIFHKYAQKGMGFI
jgi:hypothetical protein